MIVHTFIHFTNTRKIVNIKRTCHGKMMMVIVNTVNGAVKRVMGVK